MSKVKTTPQTLAQKLISQACGRPQVEVGEVVMCKVDLAMFHDSSGARRLKPMLEELGAQIWDRNKVVQIIDHYVPEIDDESRKIVRIARDWALEQQLPHHYDSEGICHVVLPQMGHLRPGMFCVGGDSHSCTGGAFGTYMFGIGSTEMLGVVVTGEIWLRVPRTLRMNWRGRLQSGVTAKDMMLQLIGRFGMNGGRYEAVEFAGEAVQALDMAGRMTLSNMSAEMGAQVGLIQPDEVTQQWLKEVAQVEVDEDLSHWCTDEGSACEQHEFDASSLTPMVARPHSPANAHAVDTCTEQRIQAAYIGACTGAKLEDLRAAAQVLKGRRVDPGVRLMVAPASQRDLRVATQEGVMDVLMSAGAHLLGTSCGACAGYGAAIEGVESVISSTARNFKGRMGSADTGVFLASPFTVAASAVTGRITDPRLMMS